MIKFYIVSVIDDSRGDRDSYEIRQRKQIISAISQLEMTVPECRPSLVDASGSTSCLLVTSVLLFMILTIGPAFDVCNQSGDYLLQGR